MWRCDEADDERFRSSPQWREGRFRHPMAREDPKGWSVLREWLGSKDPHRTPATPPPVLRRRAADFATPPPSGLRVPWADARDQPVVSSGLGDSLVERIRALGLPAPHPAG